MISMADNKWRDQKEDYFKNKTKSCQPKRKTSKVERTFQGPTQKPSLNHKQTLSKKTINGQIDIKLGQFMEEEIDTVLKKWKTKKWQA